MRPKRSERRSLWPWVWGFIFIFLTHAAAVFWLNERHRPNAPPARPNPLIYIATDVQGEQKVAELAGTDPTLFALPSHLGFSGEAWLNFTRSELASSNWTAPPSWLPLSTGQFGTDFLAVAATNRVPVDALLDDLRAATPFELRIPPGLLRPQSELTLDAGLARRGLLWTNDLPVATNTDLLSKTVMEITVNGNGFVESVALLSACGLQAMDEVAIAYARRFQFQQLRQPREKREVAVPERGKATITWRVAPPLLTNSLTVNTP